MHGVLNLLKLVATHRTSDEEFHLAKRGSDVARIVLLHFYIIAHHYEQCDFIY